MSKSAKTTENEEGEENILFDDGFSVVDDINTGTGSMEGDQEKTNGKKIQVNVDRDSNSREIVSDVRKEEITSKKNEDNDNKTVESKKKNKERVESAAKENSESKREATKTCGDAGTLIISNDVDLGAETSVSDNIKVKVEKISEEPSERDADPNEESKPEEMDTTTKKPPIRKKGATPSYVWITNITHTVNASSLKKHFSDCGRVNTAKVVTNGKLFFGYVEFDTPKIALQCVEKMNNTILNGKKILVSRNRPDVTKRTTSNSLKKPVRNDEQTGKCGEDAAKKSEEEVKDSKKTSEDKKESIDKANIDEKKKSEDEKKREDTAKTEDSDKKKKIESDRKSKNGKDEIFVKSDDLKSRMNETKKKLDTLKTDLDRTQIEIRNLRRRLTNEQKKSKSEEMRAERYRQQVRKTRDELKEAKLEFKRDIHRLTKKHKMELEKAEFDRDSFLKREDDLRRRQDDLSREFKRLEEAKKSFEHLKRSRKSRSASPPLKRFRGRDVAYPDMSPPPPPKLSVDSRKPLLDRPPSSYYEEKKPRAIYERLGDYADKPYSKNSNGRYRSSYPGDTGGAGKSSWGQVLADPWKKNTSQNSSAPYMKPYMERFGSSSYQSPSSSYYPPGTSDYPKHFDSPRKY